MIGKLKKVITIMLLCLITLVPVFGQMGMSEARAAEGFTYEYKWSDNTKSKKLVTTTGTQTGAATGTLIINLPGTQSYNIGDIVAEINFSDLDNIYYSDVPSSEKIYTISSSISSDINDTTESKPFYYTVENNNKIIIKNGKPITSQQMSVSIPFSLTNVGHIMDVIPNQEAKIKLNLKVKNNTQQDEIYWSTMTQALIGNINKSVYRINKQISSQYSSLENQNDYFFVDYLINIPIRTSTQRYHIQLSENIPFNGKLVDVMKDLSNKDGHVTFNDSNIDLKETKRNDYTRYTVAGSYLNNTSYLVSSESNMPYENYLIRIAYPNNIPIGDVVNNQITANLYPVSYGYTTNSTDDAEFVRNEMNSYTEGELYSLDKYKVGNKTLSTLKINSGKDNNITFHVQGTINTASIKNKSNPIIEIYDDELAYFYSNDIKGLLDENSYKIRPLNIHLSYRTETNGYIDLQDIPISDYTITDNIGSGFKIEFPMPQDAALISYDFDSYVIVNSSEENNNNYFSQVTNEDKGYIYNVAGFRIRSGSEILFPTGMWANEFNNAWHEKQDAVAGLIDERDKEKNLASTTEYKKYIYRTMAPVPVIDSKSELCFKKTADVNFYTFKENQRKKVTYSIKPDIQNNGYYDLKYNSEQMTLNEYYDYLNSNFDTLIFNDYLPEDYIFEDLFLAVNIKDNITGASKLENIKIPASLYTVKTNYDNTGRKGIVIDIKSLFKSYNISKLFTDEEISQINNNKITLTFTPEIKISGYFSSYAFDETVERRSNLLISEIQTTNNSVFKKYNNGYTATNDTYKVDRIYSTQAYEDYQELVNDFNIPQNIAQMLTGQKTDFLNKYGNELYAVARSEFTMQIPTVSGFRKQVALDSDKTLKTSIQIKERKEEYFYRLSLVNDENTYSRNIVFYDSLEDAFDNNENHWQGYLKSVDISFLQDAGVNPTIYYSMIPIEPEKNSNHANLSNSDIWSSTQPEDLTKVKAIAIDCGNYVLDTDKELVVDIHMVGSGEHVISDEYAFNDASIKREIKPNNETWSLPEVMNVSRVSVYYQDPVVSIGKDITIPSKFTLKEIDENENEEYIKSFLYNYYKINDIKNDLFKIKISLDNEDINGTYGDIEFINGIGYVDLLPTNIGGYVKLNNEGTSSRYYSLYNNLDNKIEIRDLPYGTKIVVKEISDYDNYEEESSSRTIKFDGKRNTTITNRLISLPTGAIKISKILTEPKKEEDVNKEFEFTIKLSDTSINETIDGVEFVNGEATVKVKDNNSITVNGIPADVSYTVTEKGEDGYSIESQNGETGTIAADETAEVTFTNKIVKYGDLEIKKVITGDLNDNDRNKEFEIQVVLSDKTISGTFGDLTFDKGIATTYLKGGQSVKATGLPKDIDFTVSEADYSTLGFTTQIDGNSKIAANETKTVTVTNTKKTGDLSVSKTVTGNKKLIDADDIFEFVITLSMKLNDTYSGVEFKDGVATITLKDGETKTITGLPAAIRFAIEEQEKAGYFLESKTGDTGEINGTSTASFTNKIEKYGDLVIKKEITGDLNETDRNREFKITVALSDKTISGTFGDLTFDKGVAIVNIKGGASVAATDLPKNVTATVTEDDYSAFGFATNISGTQTIKANESGTITVTNSKTTGNIKISKNLTGQKKTEDSNKQFEFTIDLGNTEINDTFSGVKFTNGKAIVSLRDGEEKLIEGLPTGNTYTVTEKDYSPDYEIENKTNDTGNIEANKTSNVSFTNKVQKYGDLEVTKQLTGAGITDADRNREYDITIELSDKTINGTFGDMEFTNGVAIFSIKPGATVKAVSLPKDVTYTITEEKYTHFGFATSITNDGTGIIPVNDTDKVTITNDKTVGSLEIEKVLTGQKKDVDTDKKFKFTINLSNNEYNETLSGVTFTNGEATVYLKDGQKKLIENIPTGMTYTVTEEDYSPDYIIENKVNDEGSIEKDTTKKTKFTNKVEKYGNLEVSKIITGALNDYDRSKEFKITVALNDNSINGTFGDMVFENGVAVLNLKGGRKATATGLPKDVEFTVTEDDYTNFGFATNIQGNGKIVANSKKDATVTNDKTVGNLSITKNLTGWIKDEDRQKEFNYTITLSNKEINGTFGDITFENGVATTTLKCDETKTAEALPTGITYTIVEDDYTDEKYILEKKVKDNGDIIKNETAEAVFTNRVEKYGSLSVKKEVRGALQDEFNNEYAMTVTLSDETVNGTFGDMTFVNGVATFNLKHGETATAEQIPSDLTYKVEEAQYPEFETTYNNNEGTIPRNQLTRAFVTNTRRTGDLELTKQINGGDENKYFNFRVIVKDKSFSGVYGDMTFHNGEAKVKVKANTTVKATGLPAVTNYEIIEDDYINDGYFANSENATGQIVADDIVKSIFTNNYCTGSLNIAKTSNGNDYHKGREFTFKVTIIKPVGAFNKNMTYGGVNYTTENGTLVTTVKVKEGESVQLTDIPDTFLYKVEEIEADKDGYVTAMNNDTGIINNNKTQIVAFTNTRDTFGDLTITKEGIGSGVLASKIFTIQVTLSDKTITGTFGDMDFADGVAEIQVKAGESKTAKNLPNGVTYNIEELNASLYKVTYENKTGTIKGNDKVSAKIINEKELPPIEKKVEGKEHHDLPQRGDMFTYTITTVIPDGAHNFKVTDTLVDELAFGKNVKVTANNEEIPADIKKEGQTLTCSLTKEQIDQYAGQTLIVEFDAIIDSADLSKYLVDEYIKVPNKAQYIINNAIERESNTVTITPPLPEPPIEKFVNEKKHDDLADYDEAFTYKIVTNIPEDALEFEINDEIEPVLEFASAATVKIAGKEVTVKTSLKGQHLQVLFDEDTLKTNHCKEVTVEFDAKIKKDADVLEYMNEEKIILIPNKASYTINNSFTENKVTKESDEVTVTPPVTNPEPIKYVNEKEHEDLKTYEEEFEYKVVTKIPRGAYKFTLTDNVVEELYVKENTAKVTIDGEKNKDIITVKDNTVTVEINDLSTCFDKELVLTFTAGIRPEADVLKYMTDGKILIPNKAGYYINDNSEITETNTVTITPPVTTPDIIKYVNNKEHEDLKSKTEEFVYKVKTTIPRGTDKYILSDTLVDELGFISGSAICKVGEEDIEVKNDGQLVYIELNDLSTIFNKELELTFRAKIKEDADVSKYIVDGKIKIPNTAIYELGDRTKHESNTVTVTPPEEITKTPVKTPVTPNTTPEKTTETTPSTGNKNYIPLAVILTAIAGIVIVMTLKRRKTN